MSLTIDLTHLAVERQVAVNGRRIVYYMTDAVPGPNGDRVVADLDLASLPGLSGPSSVSIHIYHPVGCLDEANHIVRTLLDAAYQSGDS